MKAHVLYDSGFGNTRHIAGAIADELAILHAKAVHVSDFDPGALAAGDLLIVGSPINAWHPTDKVTEMLKALGQRGLDGIKAAAFDTRVKVLIHGDAAKKMTSQLKKAGATIIADPMPFYVEGVEGPLREGEIQKAAAWGQKILESSGHTDLASGKGQRP